MTMAVRKLTLVISASPFHLTSSVKLAIYRRSLVGQRLSSPEEILRGPV